MTTRGKLDAMLHKEGRGVFVLYFCRGPGKCTKTASERMKLSRLHRICGDCIKGEDQQTLGEIHDKITRGDA